LKLVISKINNLLDYIETTHTEIEEMLSDETYISNSDKDEDTENKIRFPMFNISFYSFIEEFKKIPTQKQFVDYYLLINKDNYNIKIYNEDERKLHFLKCRLYRTYPSLVRDIHFSLFIKEHTNETKNNFVFYDKQMDLENGIDVGMVIKGKIYGVALFVGSERSYEFRKEKEKNRVKLFDNVNYIELPKIINHTNKKIQLYDKEDLKMLIDKINKKDFKY
jgi:hypothetical protein